MKLTDLMPALNWALLEEELTNRFGLQSTAYNPDGLSFTGRHEFVSDLCRALKDSPTALSTICAAANLNFMAEAKATGKTVIAECDAGLVKIAVPVFFDGEFLGTVGGCGKLPQGGEAEEFLIAKTTGLSDDAVAAICSTVGEISGEKAVEMAEYIENRLREIITHAKNTGRV